MGKQGATLRFSRKQLSR